MADKVELRVRRELLDPNFDGYKLSLDPLPTYTCKLDNGIAFTSLSEDQYSYHHAKLFGVHNHLYLDPWNTDYIYFIDSGWSIVQALSTGAGVTITSNAGIIPDLNRQNSVNGRLNASLCFVSEDMAVVGDGAGKLHLYFTGARNCSQLWKIVFSNDPLENSTPFLLVDAVLHTVDSAYKLECLCVHVVECDAEQKDKYRATHLTVMEWITISSGDKITWVQERSRRLYGRRPFDYAAFSKDGSALIVGAEADFVFEYDSLKPVREEEPMEAETNGQEKPEPEYTWSQNSEEVTALFTLPSGLTKADVYFILSHDFIDFGIKNGNHLLKGQLFGDIDVEGSTWKIQDQRVELTLSKCEEQVWSHIVVGDNRGEMTMDPAMIAQIHERLAGLTSDQLNPDPEEGKEKPYNSQQLEECDVFPEESSSLMRFDGDTHKITHQTSTGSHQFLFSASLDKDKPPAPCLRHDVDGIMWQPENLCKETELPWQHVATFNAFGYVQASKQNRKFTLCAPDCSFAVIFDIWRHAYVYRQPAPIATPVRNHKDGRQISHVAKQQVVSLECTDHIVGVQATSQKLYILTESVLHALQISS
ncbi:nudC domain-containing protein 1-like isoform X2 [Saccostrea echinata]|uniref:nudC domain-containing protein 1-like isoform X2 n=1 Tax=Saccostrea echinata TaxID=191078 RepID=UPI002A80BC86|nr:nudC domain-containing protein 1-like isoform X2 [Saccostrea echinata]